MLVLFAVLSSCEDNPSGALWTPYDTFNFSAYPRVIKDQPFKILQLTDIHIDTVSTETINALTIAETLITTVQPDLIVLTGDSIGSPVNGLFAELVVSFFDTFQIPYTFVFGNHDGEGYDLEDDLAKKYASGAYSWFDRGPGSIHGYSNTAINLLNGAGRLIYSLVMIDSGRNRDYSSTSSGYDYVYPDQGEWYNWLLSGLRNYTGGPVKTFMFLHIPLPEINDLRADFESKDPAGAAFAFRKDPDPSGQNSTFWATVRDSGSTTHIAFGHDHTNILNYTWQGVTWVYGLKTGSSHYHDDDRLGGTLHTIGQDGSVGIEFVYESATLTSAKWRRFMEEKTGQRVRDRPVVESSERNGRERARGRRN
jgi:hypothetical protein